MLSSIPHDQAFTQLLIDQVVTYYDKCCGWYKGELLQSTRDNIHQRSELNLSQRWSPRFRLEIMEARYG